MTHIFRSLLLAGEGRVQALFDQLLSDAPDSIETDGEALGYPLLIVPSRCTVLRHAPGKLENAVKGSEPGPIPMIFQDVLTTCTIGLYLP
jgi:hypothetical protein